MRTFLSMTRILSKAARNRLHKPFGNRDVLGAGARITQEGAHRREERQMIHLFMLRNKYSCDGVAFSIQVHLDESSFASYAFPSLKFKFVFTRGYSSSNDSVSYHYCDDHKSKQAYRSIPTHFKSRSWVF